MLERVRKEFLRPGRTVPLEAIEEASFSFAQGELVSLLGPCGCGKSWRPIMFIYMLSPMAGIQLIPLYANLNSIPAKPLLTIYPEAAKKLNPKNRLWDKAYFSETIG